MHIVNGSRFSLSNTKNTSWSINIIVTHNYVTQMFELFIKGNELKVHRGVVLKSDMYCDTKKRIINGKAEQH